MTGNVSSVPIGRLVLDPGLQCRVAIDDDTVTRYADALKAGDIFPPVAAVDVDGVLLVYDGWHRIQAHFRASRTEIEVAITPEGTHRDVQLAALQANSDHGLPRSNEDQRRAARIALMDPEWCKLSSRKLGALIKVSHTHVQNARKHYGLKKGELLDDSHAGRVDGEMNDEWKALADETDKWAKDKFEKLRIALSLDAFPTDLATGFPVPRQAVAVRIRELAEGNEVVEDLDIDTVDDLAGIDRLLGSPHLTDPERLALHDLRLAVKQLATSMEKWTVEKLTPLFAKRPSLKTAAEDKLRDIERAQADMPHGRARAIEMLAEPGQGDAILEADADTLKNIRFGNLHVSALPILRDAMGLAGIETRRCLLPDCSGWGRFHGACTICGEMLWKAEGAVKALTEVAEYLEKPGYGIQIGDVVLDVHAIELLRVLGEQWSDTPPARLPKPVRDALTAWGRAPLPKLLGRMRQPGEEDGGEE